MVLSAVATLVLLLGLLALAYNGYTEDAGSTPARTLDLAVPLLVVGWSLRGGNMAASWPCADGGHSGSSGRLAQSPASLPLGVALSIIYS